MMMSKNFETERFDFVKAERVQVAEYRFGHNELGTLDVWIESNDKSKRFLRQISVKGKAYNLHTGVYTKNCYILQEKATGRYFFLDMNDTGIWLFNSSFFGAETFNMTESIKIQKWLDGKPGSDNSKLA
jgi:hypothetical protein